MTRQQTRIEALDLFNDKQYAEHSLTKSGTALAILCKPNYNTPAPKRTPMALLWTFGRIAAAYNFTTGVIVVFNSCESTHLKKFEVWLRANEYKLKCTYFLYVRSDRVGYRTFEPIPKIVLNNHRIIRGNCVVYPYKTLLAIEDDGFEPFCNEFWG